MHREENAFDDRFAETIGLFLFLQYIGVSWTKCPTSTLFYGSTPREKWLGWLRLGSLLLFCYYYYLQCSNLHNHGVGGRYKYVVCRTFDRSTRYCPGPYNMTKNCFVIILSFVYFCVYTCIMIVRLLKLKV